MVITVSARRLHQALAAVALPRAAPRRQGPHGHGDQGRRLRRAPLRRHRPQLHPGLHRERPGATGSRCTQIPEVGPAARGKAIVNLLQPRAERDGWRRTVTVRDFSDDRYLVLATAHGTVKKTELSAFANPRASGIIGINIDEGDASRRARDRRPEGHPLRHRQGLLDPLPGERRAHRWAGPPTALNKQLCNMRILLLKPVDYSIKVIVKRYPFLSLGNRGF